MVGRGRRWLLVWMKLYVFGESIERERKGGVVGCVAAGGVPCLRSFFCVGYGREKWLEENEGGGGEVAICG